MMRPKARRGAVAALGFIACLNLSGPGRAATAPTPPPSAELTVRPGDDFYAYANSDWLKTTALPPGQAAYGTGAMLIALNQHRIEEIVQAMARVSPSRSRLQQKIGDYYASLTDIPGIDAKGLAPLTADLRRIKALHDKRTLSRYLGSTMRLGDGAGAPTDSVLSVWVHQGFSQPDRYLPHIQQGGLGLASREAYLDAASDKRALRTRYQAHIAAMLKPLGLTDPEARARRVLELEIAIARSHAAQADTDDVSKDNNLWGRSDFDARAPGMDWTAYFRAAGLESQDRFVVWQPSAVTGVAALIAQQPLQVWRDYLTFHLLEHYAAVLPKAYRELYLTDKGQDPGDIAQAEARALEMTQASLGEAIGQLYVQRYFPPSAKAAAQAMVGNIRIAFRAHLERLSWMDPATRAKAIAKLDALNVGLGYPDTWTDFSGLRIVRGDAIGNLRRAETFLCRRQLTKLGAPVDIGEWSLTPQSVNAVINFSPNAIQFSAGLLQPPYFDPDGDAASNYGSAGAAFGHEISHSFDELGNVYDAEGRLQSSWWTADDQARFKTAAEPMVAQFNAYCPLADLCVHGEQTLGEDIADLGGLAIAYDAYRLSLKGKPDVVRDGLTGDQRFFLAFARRWRKLQTNDSLRTQIMTDIHSPGAYRSDAVRNLDAWYGAFDVKPTDRLYLRPEDRVHVW